MKTGKETRLMDAAKPINLTEQQAQIANHKDGPLLVLAGAGSLDPDYDVFS